MESRLVDLMSLTFLRHKLLHLTPITFFVKNFPLEESTLCLDWFRSEALSCKKLRDYRFLKKN